PEPRTIVMRIVGGEGAGSVVETHALPLEPGRTAIIEATLATSDRPGFRAALGLGAVVRPLMERAARRLWRDDAAYAERRYAVRQVTETTTSSLDGAPSPCSGELTRQSSLTVRASYVPESARELTDRSR